MTLSTRTTHQPCRARTGKALLAAITGAAAGTVVPAAPASAAEPLTVQRLTPPGALPQQVDETLTGLGITRVVILGGPSSVSADATGGGTLAAA